MTDSKTYIFGNEGAAASNNLLASILPALQNKGVDTGYLLGMLGNGNNGGLFGGRGFEDIIALIIVAAIFGNGNGFGFGGNNQNSTEREMLMSAIQRNGVDISQLASTLNCSIGQIDNAIGQVATQICNLTGQLGMSSQQIINSVQAGNNAIAHQIADCCCRTQTAIQESNYLTERGFCNTNATVTKGFADVGYALRDQTCNIEKAIANSTSQILAGQRAAEMRELQDKLDAAREKNAQQAVFLNNSQQTAQFAAMLAPITEDLASIKCKLPKTEVVNVQPDYIPVNRGVNISYAPYYCGGYNAFGGFGYNGWNNGNCCGNSLWG
jgi:hypothetical protein